MVKVRLKDMHFIGPKGKEELMTLKEAQIKYKLNINTFRKRVRKVLLEYYCSEDKAALLHEELSKPKAIGYKKKSFNVKPSLKAQIDLHKRWPAMNLSK